MTGEPKTGDRLYEIIKADILLMEKDYGVQVIAWVTDDGPDGKRARGLLAKSHPHLIVSVCWAHQINLVVGDYLKGSGFLKVIERALEVVKWFNNHGKALTLFNNEQTIDSPHVKKALALILPIITRWTAHYLSVDRLLVVSKPMQLCCIRHHSTLLTCAGKTREHKEKAEEIITTVGDNKFWSDIVRYGHKRACHSSNR